MIIKLVFTVILFLAVVNAGIAVPAAAPIAVAPAHVVPEEIDVRPQYKYGYDVQDTLSGDAKGHVEERDGDVVRGEYSLIDPDGFRRTVTYTADPINGFNAVVRREALVVPAVPDAAIIEGSAVPIGPVVKTAPLTAAAPVARIKPSFTYSRL